MTNITGGELNSFSTSSKLLIDNGDGKISKIKPSNSGFSGIHSYTYATLPSTFIVGDTYKIIDATKSINSGNVPNGLTLLVKAVSTTALSFDAQSQDYPKDIIVYDPTSDNILFRWDTVYNHAQFADWRNGLGVAFTNNGTATNTFFGKGCTGTLACNPIDCKFGHDCILNISAANEISYVNIGNQCSITSSGVDTFRSHTIGSNVTLSCVNFGTEDAESRNTIGNDCSISVVGDIIGSSIGNGCNITLTSTGDIIDSNIPNGCNITLSGQSITNSTLTPFYSISSSSDVLTSMNSNRNLCVQYASPTAGSTITVNYQTNALLLKPSGTLATLTINLPDATNVKEGYKVTISSNQIITDLTLNAPNASFPSAVISSLAVGVPVSYVYMNTGGNSFWFKC